VRRSRWRSSPPRSPRPCSAPPRPPPSRPPATPEVRAADWLAGQLDEDGLATQTFDGESFVDYGRSLDAAIALLSARTQTTVLRRTLASTSTPEAVASYTQGDPFDREDAAYVGATAKLAFVVELTGGDATRTGGVDLLAQLQSLATEDGRFADRSDFGSFANLFGHSFALLAQQAAGRTVPQVQVAALLREQCPDGGFPVSYSGGSCTGSVDATGLVLQALTAVGAGGSSQVTGAVTWLQGQQQADGGFPGEVRQNSTGYAAAGLLAVDPASRAAADAAAYLRTQQNADGGLNGPEQGQSDAFATSQALPALAGRSFLAAARDERLYPLCDAAPALRFSDVPAGDVHAVAIACLSGLDVARGGSDGTYRPAAVVTRAQTASLLARALQAAGVRFRPTARASPTCRRATSTAPRSRRWPSSGSCAVARRPPSSRRCRCAATRWRRSWRAPTPPRPAASCPRRTPPSPTSPACTRPTSVASPVLRSRPAPRRHVLARAPGRPRSMASFVARTTNLVVMARGASGR
jgi:hypothetical protein